MKNIFNTTNIYLISATLLTTISMIGGFDVYNHLIGIEVAILSVIVFEILRLVTLYFSFKEKLTKKNFLKRAFTFSIYLIVVIFCSNAASASFLSRMVKHYQDDSIEYRDKIEEGIYLVKKTYGERYDEKLLQVEKDIERAKKNLAVYPNSNKWKIRQEQLLRHRMNIQSERDSLLSSVSKDNKEEWLVNHSAILGLQFQQLPEKGYNSVGLITSLKDLLYIENDKTVQLGVSRFLSIGIEICILFLVILSKDGVKIKKRNEHKLKGDNKKSNGSIGDVLTEMKNLFNSNNGKQDVESQESKTLDGQVTETKPPFQDNGKEMPKDEAGSHNETRAEKVTPKEDANPVESNTNAKRDVHFDIMNRLRTEFEEELIQRFLEKAVRWYSEKGNIIPTNRVSKNLQEIRHFLAQEFSKKELFEFFGALLVNSNSK